MGMLEALVIHNFYSNKNFKYYLTIVKKTMPELMRQEIEVWDVLPSLRRELAKALLKSGLSQRETADKLGITEAAVSQYLSSKRAKGMVFGRQVLAEVRKSAAALVDGAPVVGEMQRLCDLVQVRKMVCEIHMKRSNLPKDCCICGK
jgi:predicted transcriptional regulator